MTTYFGIFAGEEAPAIAAALGDMLLAWQMVEELQAEAMALMLNLSLDAAFHFYEKFPNFRSRTQMLYTLLDMSPECEVLRRDIRKFSNLSKTRNRYVHGTFLKSKNDPNDIRSVMYSEPWGSPRRSVPTKATDILYHAEVVRRRARAFRICLNALPKHVAWREEQGFTWSERPALESDPADN